MRMEIEKLKDELCVQLRSLSSKHPSFCLTDAPCIAL
jgi:hypothetical protein